MKLVIAFVFFLIVMLLAVPFALKSATEKGKIQITLTYSLAVLNIILSFLAIFLSTSTFCSDIRDKIIFTIDTKPVKRWEILGGKWLGVMILNLILLTCAGGAIYGLVKYLAGSVKDNGEIQAQVLTARAEARPEVFESGGKAYVVSPRSEQEWKFRGVKPSEDIVHVKFRSFSSGDKNTKIAGLWTIGNMERGFYRHVSSFLGGSFHEFQAPASVISPEGDLDVKFMNISSDNIAAIFPRHDVMILYQAGNFGENFFRGMLLILLRVAFISAVAIASSTFLTFPVATLFSVFVFVMSLSIPFVTALLGQGLHLSEATGLIPGQVGSGSALVGKVLTVFLKVFPDLRAYDPVPYVVGGLLISWTMILKGLLGIVILRCGVIGLIAYIIFNRRELANMGYL